MSGLITCGECKLILRRTELCLVVVSEAFTVLRSQLMILTLNRKLCFREDQSSFLISENYLHPFQRKLLVPSHWRPQVR